MKPDVPRTTCGPGRLLGLCLVAGLGLAGCASPEAGPRPRGGNNATEVVRSDRADAVVREALASYHRYRTMQPADQVRELSAQLDQKRADLGQLQVAMLTALQHGPGDLGRALALLEGLKAQKTADALALRPLVLLLYMQWSEQRRLEEQMDKLAQQLKDEQKRADQLSEKLEGMKAIERNLQPRLPRPPGSPG